MKSMADTKGSSSFRNSAGKQSFLPPKSPIPTVPPSYADYNSAHCMPLRGIPKPRHQRTSSESLIIDEQPSWLEDLLDEPETPVRRGSHRRSSSDSFAYTESTNSSLDTLAHEGHKHQNTAPLTSWGSGDFDYSTGSNLGGGSLSRGWESAFNVTSYPSFGRPLANERALHQGPSCRVKDFTPGLMMPKTAEMKDKEECPQDPSGSSERRESEMDSRRVKQQYAQRSRVRKLQYIAELERNVQALQVEGLDVSAELSFLNQQNFMMDLENKALKQRLESLAQEHLIKCLQHETLDREVARLRALFFHQQQQQRQQQQQQQQATPTHGRRNSRDLDSQFSGLSLKQKETNSGSEPVNDPLQT